MLRRTPIEAVTALALLASATTAQQTWIVDQNQGPGTNFTDIQPAVDAASNGDTILVRDGVYGPFHASKTLRVLGSANTAVLGAAPVLISDIPAGGTFVLDSLGSFLCWLNLANNAGTVHAADCTFNRLTADACTLATFTGCTLGDTVVSSSVVSMAACDVQGTGSVTSALVPSVDVRHGTLLISASAVRGPDFRPGPGPMDLMNGPALGLDNARAVISAGSSLAAGNPLGGLGGRPSPAILATASELEIDPTATITGVLGAPAIQSDRPTTTRTIPGLFAAGAPPGGTLTADLRAPPGLQAVVAISLPVPVVRLPFGDLALDPGSLFLAGSGTVPPSGLFAASLAVPNLPIDGTPIAVQGVVLPPTSVVLGAPATVVLH